MRETTALGREGLSIGATSELTGYDRNTMIGFVGVRSSTRGRPCSSFLCQSGREVLVPRARGLFDLHDIKGR